MPDQPASSQPHATSALARLQQVLAVVSLLMAGGWWWVWQGTSPAWAWGGAGCILLGYSAVLALEFVLMAQVNRHDAAPCLGWPGLVRAWWHEVRVAPVVFSWRQPFLWRRWPDSDHAAMPGTRAAVLVHGFVCNRGLWLPWMRELRRRGLSYTSVNLEPVFGSIDDYAPLIDEAVQRAQALTGLPPLLVCHSMGGLAARAWLAGTPGAAQRVSAVVTIGTPHQGTWLARWSYVTNGIQMRMGGPWLLALQAREAAQQRPPFVCWYSNSDNVVFPASAATLPGADNRHLPGQSHVAMAFHPEVMDASMAMLVPSDGSPAGHATAPSGAQRAATHAHHS